LPDGDVIWKKVISFEAKRDNTENDKYAARRIAEKLYIDWNRSKNKYKN
jgi:hypothetical protein